MFHLIDKSELNTETKFQVVYILTSLTINQKKRRSQLKFFGNSVLPACVDQLGILKLSMPSELVD